MRWGGRKLLSLTQYLPTYQSIQSTNIKARSSLSTNVRTPPARARLASETAASHKHAGGECRTKTCTDVEHVGGLPLSCTAFFVKERESLLAACCDHLPRPPLYECYEAVERLGEIVSGGGKAQAEMRERIEAIAGSQEDSTLGGGLAERAVVLSAH